MNSLVYVSIKLYYVIYDSSMNHIPRKSNSFAFLILIPKNRTNCSNHPAQFSEAKGFRVFQLAKNTAGSKKDNAGNEPPDNSITFTKLDSVY